VSRAARSARGRASGFQHVFLELIAMSSETIGAGYNYYTSTEASSGDLARSRRDCEALGRLRLNPVLGDMDYLIFKPRAAIVRDFCAEVTGTGLVVLDIGGRIQPYRPLLDGKASQHIGIDLILEGLVDVIADGTRLPFQDDSVDVILCNDALQYFARPREGIEEMLRVLRPGGRLILSTRSNYPEHHDEHWRFFPHSLRAMTERFSSVSIRPESNSAAGVVLYLNVLLHRDIQGYRLNRLAQMTSIPLLNLLGDVLNRVGRKHTRAACGYTLSAIK
jgi:SAM-dependent methyltransferase